MWLEKVETLARTQAADAPDAAADAANASDAAVVAGAKHARILLCDFALDGDAWAETLAAAAKQWHKLKQELFLGDLFTCGGWGEDVLSVKSGTRMFLPNCYYSSRYGQLSAEEQAHLLKPWSKEQLKQLKRYDTIELVAHGLGVRLAAVLLNSFPESWFATKAIRGIALAGTVSAVDDKRGMSSELWATTLDQISIATMEQYYLNFFNTSTSYFNLRGKPIDLALKAPRRTQSQLRTQTEFKQRVLECAQYRWGASDYVKLVSDLCYNAARRTIFRSGGSPRYRNLYSGRFVKSKFNLFLLILSAELCFAPQAPLGKLGRTRFDRYIKLHYAYSGDVLCPAEAVQADLEMTGGASAQVRTLEGPHLNCEQICQLLLSPAHPDWAEAAQLVAQSQ